MTDNKRHQHPIPPFNWADNLAESGAALEELARTATDAELAALVYAIGHHGITAANVAEGGDRLLNPRSIWTLGVAGAVLGRELASRHGFEQDLMPAWAATLNRQILDGAR